MPRGRLWVKESISNLTHAKGLNRRKTRILTIIIEAIRDGRSASYPHLVATISPRPKKKAAVTQKIVNMKRKIDPQLIGRNTYCLTPSFRYGWFSLVSIIGIFRIGDFNVLPVYLAWLSLSTGWHVSDGKLWVFMSLFTGFEMGAEEFLSSRAFPLPSSGSSHMGVGHNLSYRE